MGVSSVFAALSLLGFLGFLGGVALIVLSSSQGRPIRSGILLAVAGIIVGVLFSVISQGIVIVQPTEVAVVVNTLNGNLDPNARRGGTHLIVPVVQQPFLYPVVQQTVTMAGQISGADEGAVVARTSDGQEVRLDVTVLYSGAPENVNRLPLLWQRRYQDEFVTPQTRGIVRDAVSGFEAAQIYSGGREALSEAATERLRRRMAQDGLVLSDMIIRDITFSEQYAQAIEQAQVAAQEAERARLVVQQRQQEAAQARAVAQGQADAEVTRAQGEAQAIVLRAEAEAQALALVSEVLALNPSLIQYQYVQRLADNISIALVPSASPFLFDLEGLTQQLSNADGNGAVENTPTPTPEPTPQAEDEE